VEDLVDIVNEGGPPETGPVAFHLSAAPDISVGKAHGGAAAGKPIRFDAPDHFGSENFVVGHIAASFELVLFLWNIKVYHREGADAIGFSYENSRLFLENLPIIRPSAKGPHPAGCGPWGIYFSALRAAL
jgi:hypothetical protein